MIRFFAGAFFGIAIETKHADVEIIALSMMLALMVAHWINDSEATK